MNSAKTETPFAAVHPDIEAYMRSLAGDAAPLAPQTLKRMEKHAAKTNFPVVGRLVGRFLFQQALIAGARSVFEMGSGFGYSAYWFACAAGQGGRVICTDFSSERVSLGREFMREAGLAERVSFSTGDALDILKESEGGFDIIFNDIDKEKYPETIEAARSKLRTGGLFISDNSFWDGRAVSTDGSDSAEGVIRFNRELFTDPGFLTVQIPLRDGVAVSLKLR